MPSFLGSCLPLSVFYRCYLSVSNSQVVQACGHAHAARTDADTQAPRHMGSFTWSTYMGTYPPARTWAGARWRSSSWSQSYLCFFYAPYPHRPCLFTPPVTIDHHLPSCCWSQRYLQTVLGRRKKTTKNSDLDILSTLHDLEHHRFINCPIVVFRCAPPYLTL